MIFVAGKGTRMKGYNGNKSLLPLVPEKTPFSGKEPILLHILKKLPPGPKALIVHHRKDDVIETTKDMGLIYCVQKETDGTGGALLAGKDFIINGHFKYLIITMGDVPFVKKDTYLRLIKGLDECSMMILGFKTKDKKRYGLLKIQNNCVLDIIEWEHWKDLPEEVQSSLNICNGGIYAVRRDELIPYLSEVKRMPHVVMKERNGKKIPIKEFFITDIVKLMARDGLKVGYTLSDEKEVMGIDDLESLILAQKQYSRIS